MINKTYFNRFVIFIILKSDLDSTYFLSKSLNGYPHYILIYEPSEIEIHFH